MTRRPFLLLLLAAVSVGDCVARSRVNASCEWTNDAAAPLDFQRAADVRHLMNDAMTVEELAIRYADATRGRRSGHFAGWDEYESTRERCMTSLFDAAAGMHGVNARQVRDLLGRRPLAVDLSVVLLFGALYVVVSHAIVVGILRRFPVDEPAPLAIAFVAVALVLSACGVLVLGLWAGLIEMVRFGNAHLSYRVDRLPWNHHVVALLAAGAVVFLTTAAVRAAASWASRNVRVY